VCQQSQWEQRLPSSSLQRQQQRQRDCPAPLGKPLVLLCIVCARQRAAATRRDSSAAAGMSYCSNGKWVAHDVASPGRPCHSVDWSLPRLSYSLPSLNSHKGQAVLSLSVT